MIMTLLMSSRRGMWLSFPCWAAARNTAQVTARADIMPQRLCSGNWSWGSHGRAGGLFSFVRTASIAEAAGIPCWHGGGLELGIAGMSHVHACTAARGCILPSDLVGSFSREDDLIVTPVRFEDGCAMVPQEPGLGVEIDMGALAKYSVE